MTTATHARFMDYGKRGPDPTTATCAQHAVGAPSNEATKATNAAQPLPAGISATCTVCGTENADLIGLLVLDWSGDSDCVYAGPDERRRAMLAKMGETAGRGGGTRSYSLLRGGPAELFCEPLDVAPADTVVPVKDARVVVVKRQKHELPDWVRATKAGKYELQLPGEEPSYFDKKGEAVAVGHVRLAIIDWHAARAS